MVPVVAVSRTRRAAPITTRGLAARPASANRIHTRAQGRDLTTPTHTSRARGDANRRDLTIRDPPSRPTLVNPIRPRAQRRDLTTPSRTGGAGSGTGGRGVEIPCGGGLCGGGLCGG
ncbi:hypothetical protein GCM10010116_37400 [Microbispora rosea subsp. aerata]|nr:hypothetical protein GCM10010116_37400 [Microbispora rosea subsp. aerata]GIH54363.1 hypothetical protein Mro02_12770 [Microbispora rosea subsp. aerata]GLJ81333.1 hypothetical protein GCM10017588_00560 [Microbispora rosea subsp. aerata]